MALWEDLFAEAGWGTAGVIGLGSFLFAPALVPVVGTVVRPVLKGLIWGTLAVTDGIQSLLAETGTQVSALYTEVRQEAAQSQEDGVTPPESRIVTTETKSAPAASPLVTPEGKPLSSV